MVVLVIIGVLAALIVPNVLDRADDARVTAARTDVNNLMQALKLYKLDNQRYPTAEQGLAGARSPSRPPAPIPPNWKPYLDKLPNDPWGHPYQYANPGLKGEIDVYSFGADGVVGGEGNECRHRLAGSSDAAAARDARRRRPATRLHADRADGGGRASSRSPPAVVSLALRDPAATTSRAGGGAARRAARIGARRGAASGVPAALGAAREAGRRQRLPLRRPAAERPICRRTGSTEGARPQVHRRARRACSAPSR